MTEFKTISETLPQTLPLDEHNKRLVQNVHPPNWVNPKPSGRYNLVVIGAGTAGLVTAAGAAGLGAKVALIERALMGGDCLNVGCVPSKALLRCAHAYADVRDAHKFGVDVPRGFTVDFPAVMERMRRLRAGISHHDSAAGFVISVSTCSWAAQSSPDPTRSESAERIWRSRKPVLPPEHGRRPRRSRVWPRQGI